MSRRSGVKRAWKHARNGVHVCVCGGLMGAYGRKQSVYMSAGATDAPAVTDLSPIKHVRLPLSTASHSPARSAPQCRTRASQSPASLHCALCGDVCVIGDQFKIQLAAYEVNWLTAAGIWCERLDRSCWGQHSTETESSRQQLRTKRKTDWIGILLFPPTCLVRRIRIRAVAP